LWSLIRFVEVELGVWCNHENVYPVVHGSNRLLRFFFFFFLNHIIGINWFLMMIIFFSKEQFLYSEIYSHNNVLLSKIQIQDWVSIYQLLDKFFLLFKDVRELFLSVCYLAKNEGNMSNWVVFFLPRKHHSYFEVKCIKTF